MNSPLRILRGLIATLIALGFVGAAAFGADPATTTESAPAASSALVALAGVGAALGAAGLLGGLRRRGDRRARHEAHEIAFHRLRVARGLMVRDSSRDFAAVVSAALREYIEGRFGVQPGGTTNQLTIALLRSDSAELREWAVILKDIFDHCDLAEMTGRGLSGGQIDLMHLRAWQFIRKTRVGAVETPERRRRAA